MGPCLSCFQRRKVNNPDPNPPANSNGNDNDLERGHELQNLQNGRAQNNNPSHVPGRENRIVRPITPLQKSPAGFTHGEPWTRQALEWQRNAYFETQQGNQDSWLAAREACRLFALGDSVSAQTVLNAAQITCPSGKIHDGPSGDRVKGGLYDSSGRFLRIPHYCVSEPQDLLEHSPPRPVWDPKSRRASFQVASVTGDSSEAQTSEDSINSQSKGKGPAKEEDYGRLVEVRIRCNEPAQDFVVRIGERRPVHFLASIVCSRVPGATKIRLVYQGKQFNMDQILCETRYQEGNVMNCFVLADRRED